MTAPEQGRITPPEVALISDVDDVRLFVDPWDRAHVAVRAGVNRRFPWRSLPLDESDDTEGAWADDDIVEAERLIPASPLLAFAHRISEDPATAGAAGELRALLAHILGETGGAE